MEENCSIKNEPLFVINKNFKKFPRNLKKELKSRITPFWYLQKFKKILLRNLMYDNYAIKNELKLTNYQLVV